MIHQHSTVTLIRCDVDLHLQIYSAKHTQSLESKIIDEPLNTKPCNNNRRLIRRNDSAAHRRQHLKELLQPDCSDDSVSEFSEDHGYTSESADESNEDDTDENESAVNTVNFVIPPYSICSSTAEVIPPD